jgi:hypothetical protein
VPNLFRGPTIKQQDRPTSRTPRSLVPHGADMADLAASSADTIERTQRIAKLDPANKPWRRYRESSATRCLPSLGAVCLGAATGSPPRAVSRARCASGVRTWEHGAHERVHMSAFTCKKTKERPNANSLMAAWSTTWPRRHTVADRDCLIEASQKSCRVPRSVTARRSASTAPGRLPLILARAKCRLVADRRTTSVILVE